MASVMLQESYWPAIESTEVRDTTVGGILRDAAARWPDATALVAGTPDPAERRRWTYAELLADAERAARALAGRFQPGEKVAVWAPNIPEWIVLEFAAGLAGVVLVTVNPAYRPSELAYVLEQSGSVGIFLVPEFRSPMLSFLEEVRPQLPRLREVVQFAAWDEFVASGDPNQALPEVSPDDIAQIQYTSGTTGFPKGALLHHRGITNNSRCYGINIGMKPGDVYVNPMPMFHTAGCAMGALGTVQAGVTHVPLVYFDPGLALDLLESERSSGIMGVPTMLIAIMEHPEFRTRDLSSLRYAVSGGSTVPPDLVRRIEADLGVTFSIVYGTTECSPLITQILLDDAEEDRCLTLGRPVAQAEVKIIDPATGDVLPTGAVGELCARGYLVMHGYHDNPEATAEAIDDEGWYHTGDLASMDDRGYLRIEGRVKDMIIRGGENIYPREIEDLLFTHPGVAEASVLGVPDEKWGEIVVAFIRPAPLGAPSEAELRAFCRENLAPYKTPVRWEFVESFPLTPSGKIQKFKLRDSLR